jgi:ABC-type bacteriocin/lantibiotic exporter with double-glycine peptidase domain
MAKNDVQFADRLVLKNINFTYPCSDSQVLININIDISKGETIGFIGTSGSGKSTLVDIILGLLTPTGGSMELDGIEIKEDIKSWQKLVGYVPQTIFLTDDTIRNNIAFGIQKKDIDEEAVNTALIAAQLNKFIKSLPEGLDTCVGEQGVRLSGGQRQRIGLARALYRNPEMLVLDEATSALDLQTEGFIMETVLKLRGKKTIILVAHRLSTLRNCDRIFKLENGVIIQEDVPEKIL